MTADAARAAGLDAGLASLARVPRLLVCCDFDGTISALADDPAAARPVDGAVAALAALAALPDTWTAVVSGRALIDLTQLAGMPERVHLVGSHGNEFEIGAILAVSPGEDAVLRDVVTQCQAIVDAVPGAFLELKTGSVAVLVRMAASEAGRRALAEVRSGPGSAPGVHILEGKDVVELAIFPGAKGDAVKVLRARWDISAPLFVGDDVTDESGFAVLEASDMGIKVGSGDSRAAWRLPDPAAVVDLLVRLALARSPLRR